MERLLLQAKIQAYKEIDKYKSRIRHEDAKEYHEAWLNCSNELPSRSACCALINKYATIILYIDRRLKKYVK